SGPAGDPSRDAGAALTPLHAAPEQLTGGIVSTSTDVYQLGVMLYLLLTGGHPCGANVQSDADLIDAIGNKAPARGSDAVVADSERAGRTAALRSTTRDRLKRLLAGDLDAILARALMKAPQDRYAPVTALADDVRRHLAHEPIKARAGS